MMNIERKRTEFFQEITLLAYFLDSFNIFLVTLTFFPSFSFFFFLFFFFNSNFSHPNVIQFVGYCEFPPCVITKLYDSDLFRLMRSSPSLFTNSNVSKLAFDIAQGMLCIHNSGVIHKDLKSLNVLITLPTNDQRISAVICDFGISRIVKESKIANQKFSVVLGMTPR